MKTSSRLAARTMIALVIALVKVTKMDTISKKMVKVLTAGLI